MLLKVCGLALAIAMIASVAKAQAAQPLTLEANNAVAYIESLQNTDGGFPAFGTESTAGSTIDAIFALKAAGVDVGSVTSADGSTPVDYLETQAATYSSEAGALAKLILCVRLVGADVANFGGVNLLGEIDSHFDDTTGTFGDDNFDQALFVLAGATFESSPKAERLRAAADRLLSLQQAGGGWEFAEGQGRDSNTTAIVLQALLATNSNPSDQAVQSALVYLVGTQNDDGGFGFLSGADTDPNSTALVIQALVAAHENIGIASRWDRGGSAPFDGLMSFYNGDTGAFQYAGEDSPFATYQAVPALMLAPFPDLQTHVEGEPTRTATAIATVVPPTATPQPVLPTAGAASPASDAKSMWVIAMLAAAGTILLGATFVLRKP